LDALGMGLRVELKNAANAAPIPSTPTPTASIKPATQKPVQIEIKNENIYGTMAAFNTTMTVPYLVQQNWGNQATIMVAGPSSEQPIEQTNVSVPLSLLIAKQEHADKAVLI
jgi:hypothetical protein